MIKNVCVGDKKIPGSCDEHIQQYIMPNSVKTCGLCKSKARFLKMLAKAIVH